MIGIKKLDRFILKNFALVFAGSFFICLFVFMMQFTWRYVDELIGKGLSLEILAKFFWYMGLTLVPTALPLAFLLGSLISFGNMGERLEILAMKAAGVPLIRIMRPIMVVAVLGALTSFYFQNNTAPQAQLELRTLLMSMKQSSPAVEIPEGTFYNGIPNVNLYVERKNAATGMLYQMIIYKTDQGFDRAQIVLADSGKLEVTADKHFLRLQLWSGEQFENLQQQSMSNLMQGANVPYDRETFCYKQLLITFDSNFNLMSASELAGMPSAKNLEQIDRSVDSMNHVVDSLGMDNYRSAMRQFFDMPHVPAQDSLRALRMARSGSLTFDRLTDSLSAGVRQQAARAAGNRVSQLQSDLEWRGLLTKDNNSIIRRHLIEWHQKFTLSLACLFFFFIGAPLGAIIRKGGLGMPTVVSVLIFIFYYIINTSGMKMARDGSWNMIYGMWVSTFVLTPVGLFLTYKSNKDSVVFNMEVYTRFFRRLLGLRTKRHIFVKEVIIEDPDYATLPVRLTELKQCCRRYAVRENLLKPPGYVSTFFHHRDDHEISSISEQMEQLVEEMSNSRDRQLLMELERFPILFTRAHVTPFSRHWLNVACGVLFPLGCIIWFRMWRFRLRLMGDIRQIIKTCEALTVSVARVEAEMERRRKNTDD